MRSRRQRLTSLNKLLARPTLFNRQLLLSVNVATLALWVSVVASSICSMCNLDGIEENLNAEFLQLMTAASLAVLQTASTKRSSVLAAMGHCASGASKRKSASVHFHWNLPLRPSACIVETNSVLFRQTICVSIYSTAMHNDGFVNFRDILIGSPASK